MTPVTPITSQSELDSICARAGAAGRFGLDTEFVRDETYYSRLALLQLAVGEEVALVDPLADIDLSPLEALVNDESVVTVLHAGTQDLEIFFQRTGRPAASVFDTQVAGAMCGLGHQVGYAQTVQSVLDVQLSKGSQRSDWLRRPLRAKQLEYAADDVRYLLPLMDVMLEQLGERGRKDVAAAEMARLCDPDRFRVTAASVAARLKGASRLRPRELAIVRRLVAWREEQARRRDIPRRWVVADAPLVDLARDPPTTERELSHIRGLHRRETERSGRAILAAIRTGQADPLPEGPKVDVSRSANPAGPIVRAVVEALCKSADIAPVMVCTSQSVDLLVAAHADGRLEQAGSPLLEGWRGELLGKPLLAFLEGRLAIRMDPETREIRFEPAG